ncbi:unnamed protein product, partial [Effrenium voratum]
APFFLEGASGGGSGGQRGCSLNPVTLRDRDLEPGASGGICPGVGHILAKRSLAIQVLVERIRQGLGRLRLLVSEMRLHPAPGEAFLRLHRNILLWRTRSTQSFGIPIQKEP